MDSLINIWREANHIKENADPVPSILLVDAVAFRPNITINESGKAEGVNGIDHLESPDLFTQFVLDPDAFRRFLMEHFDRACTYLFVYQIRLLIRNSPVIWFMSQRRLVGKALR
jgi:hypothetical protein